MKNNMSEKKKIDGLVSTIIAGIFLLISIFIVINLIPLNLKQELAAYAESVKNSSEENTENAGEMIIVTGLVAGIGGLAIILFFYSMAIIPIIPSIIFLLLAIKNIKKDNKAIKVINIIYIILFSLILITCITKIVLFATGIA